MKALIITVISIALLATIGNAQETVSDKYLENKRAEVVGQLKKVVESKPMLFGQVIKNKPYSVEAVSESIQVLQDGNRITRSTTVKMFRDSEGRTRREGSGIVGKLTSSDISGFFSAFPTGFSNTISINDPVDSVRYTLDPKTKTARRYDNQNLFGTISTKIITNNSTFPQKIGTTNSSEMSAEERAEMEKDLAKTKEDLAKTVKDLANIKNDLANVVILGSLGTLSYKSSETESLGTKTIEGVEAEGTRTVNTIEAGAVGNELPIEITYEKWYSKDLDLVVYSRKYDPRSGEQIYRLVNINQTEPDRSLFTVPSDYKMIEQSKSTLKSN